jgi:hypothetical protein
LSGQAFAQILVEGTAGGPLETVQTAEPMVPGEFSQSLQLTPTQRTRLSAQADYFIYGPSSLISRQEILSLRQSRLQALVGTIIGKNLKTVNNRAYFLENLSTIYTTQSETSSAVYGKHIVAGWNDAETYLLNNSTANWAVSHDGGVTFTASTTGLPTQVAPGVTLTLGDPAVAVDPMNGTFYYATLSNYNDGTTDFSAISVYRSLDFGDTFNLWWTLFTGDTAVFFDKDLIAVDPSNGKVYVTFTRFGSVSPLFTIISWNVTDTLLTTVQSNDTGLQGSIPAVGADHALYVAYESWDVSNNPYIKINKSTDSGATFGTEINVYGPFIGSADAEASFFCGRSAIKGNIRSNEFPSLAVDTRASGAGHGNLYIAFNARDSVTNTLDVYLTRSIDGGATWSALVRANPRPVGDASDKSFPWVSVNGTGKVGLIYYDRKKSPNVTGLSNNNWWISTNIRRFTPALVLIDAAKVSPEFPVIVNNDYLAKCYMAEYNSISANRKGLGDDNFFAFWGDNRFGDPDIQFSKIVNYVP